jgi:hypothetical protein
MRFGQQLALQLTLLGVLASCALSDPSSNVSTTNVITSSPLTPTSPESAPTTAAPINNLFDFSDSESLVGWSTQNDTVMGGVSQSTATWDSGQLVFAGDLSLDNNGGFTSLVSPIDMSIGTALIDGQAIVVTAVGDGKTYLLQLRLANNTRFIQRFTTQPNEVDTYVLPLNEFEAVDWRLSVIPNAEPMDVSKIGQISIYLLDKQTGTFRLAISSITFD